MIISPYKREKVTDIKNNADVLHLPRLRFGDR